MSPSQAYNQDEVYCLTQTIYFESRGEPIAGQLAVGLVVLNRVDSSEFPETICTVIKQRCQFSWYCDGKSDKLPDTRAAKLAKHIALVLMSKTIPDFTQGALFFHAKELTPQFSEKTIAIGNHIFYRGS